MTDTVRKDVQDKLARGLYNCPKELTLSMFNGKWKINILYHLGQEGRYYFGELQRLLPKASHKEIAEKLKELANDALVTRTVETGAPVKVAYALTPLGESLMPIINAMYDWGVNRLAQLQNQPVTFGLGQTKK
ncbi:transcriptional regulator [Secundilactobacillus kimchicus]|uniref:HxlR family transcriptional regulator n=1 Tax=Secundilactobacillus kimchicus JCM 15530 TaxID=1302272 RepID=A0A0R1HUY1_9LACO|nr:helix-turn-helix domain-containing protein [Secundilactobacillus kimchicus]KRK47114.1 HxlR family transcriptional regulator [Secundilactobacillus kimchicus JCM 15530]MBT9672524.1 transcriptional regulator [Secundilactobacillus kimchicus]